ncbi:undecaprenyl pyrophosphate phosphatase [compost metagenome]
MTSTELISLGVGFLVSFLVALAVIKKFIAYLQKKPMKVFVYYRMVFAIIVLVAGIAGFFK